MKYELQFARLIPIPSPDVDVVAECAQKQLRLNDKLLHFNSIAFGKLSLFCRRRAIHYRDTLRGLR